MNRDADYQHIAAHRNLRRTLYQLAAQSSAQFILDNMPCARVFDCADDIMDWALGQAPPGPAAEFGVCYGTTLARIAAHRFCYGFDSFQGLPEAWRTDFPAGTFNDAQPPNIDNTELLIGLFDDTVPAFTTPCAFVHIDCDLYSAAKRALTIPLLPGAIILFNEYLHYPSWQDCEHRALQESGLDVEYLAYVNTDEQVAVRLR